MIRYVYVAGPISHGDQFLNIRNGIEASSKLMDHGLVPHCPHLHFFEHMIFPHDYEDWIRIDLAWIERCDALLRLPGYSPGSEREVAHAVGLGKPVFNSIEDLLKTVKKG